MALKSKSLDLVRPTVPVEAVTKEDLVRVNLNVSKATRQSWKAAALERDMTLAELLNEAMSRYLNVPLNK